MSLTIDAPAASARRATSGLVVSIGDRDGEARRESFNDGDDAADLLVRRHDLGAGAGGLAADVEDVGTVGNQGLGAGEGVGRAEGEAAVGEAVGRRVDDPHHAGTLAVGDDPAAGDPGGHGSGLVRTGFVGEPSTLTTSSPSRRRSPWPSPGTSG